MPNYTFRGRNKLTMIRLQVDVYGDTGAQCVLTGRAIYSLLSGYKGVLPDPDATVVQGIFASDVVDFFDDNARTCRRMLEFEVHYEQS